MKYSFASACAAITRWSLYGALFLTPIFFLPLTLYPVDLSKQALFTALVLIGAIAWLAGAVSAGKFEYAKSPIGIAAGALAIFAVVSSLFSGVRAMSFMGRTGGEADTALAVISFAAFYFLLAGTFREKEGARNAFVAFLAGAVLSMVPVLMQAVGIGIFPWGFANEVGFNAMGTTNALGLYFGLIFLFSFAGARHCLSWGKRARIACGVIAGLSFVIAFLIGYWAVFAGLIVSLLILAAIGGRGQAAKDSRRNLLPISLIVISAAMLIISRGALPVPVPRMGVPAEIAPTVGASWHIVKETARESVKNFVVGSGPATYQYQYGKYRDASLNQQGFWNVRFTQGFDAILTHLVSWGAVGTVIFLLFIAAFLSEIFLLARAKRASGPLAAAFVAAGAYLVIALFSYPQNFTLYFFLFACAGIASSFRMADKDGQGTVVFASSSNRAFAWPFAAVAAIAIVAALSYANARRYIGAVSFARGMEIGRGTGDMEKAIPFLMRGARLDRGNEVYLQVLAQAFLAQGNALAGQAVKDGGSPESEEKVAAAVNAAIAFSEQAAQANEKSVANFLALAGVYEAVMPLNPGVAENAFAAYAIAAYLEPNNPAIPVSLGRAHMAYADRIPKEKRDAEYQAALSAFEAALALKSDYAPAHFALVSVFDREGRPAEALARAERLRSIAPNDAGILFQLGIVHYQAERFLKAQEVLADAVKVAPDYANALYFLGLAYDRNGDRASALAQFERVLRLNPGNADIAAVISNVKSGRPALASDSAPQPLEDAAGEVLKIR